MAKAHSPTKKIQRLRAQIQHHNRLYYLDATPDISDREYDGLLKELEDLEAQHPEHITPDSPTQRVGGETIDGFQSVKHSVPMMSLTNTYSREELVEFDGRVNKLLEGRPYTYLLEPKIDGVAISLRYEEGRHHRKPKNDSIHSSPAQCRASARGGRSTRRGVHGKGRVRRAK